MKMNSLFGGILLVSGTTIGVGMLAFPLITAFAGFIPSLLVFAFCWMMMLMSAYFLLDVNLVMKGESNMMTMASRTLGVWGKVVCWFVYLLLLYALTAAYISGSASLFGVALQNIAGGSALSPKILPFILPVIFGGFIYFGTRGVDYINRLMMLFLGVCYVVLIMHAPADIQTPLLAHFDLPASVVSISIVVTAFGYHIIIPTLTTYLNRNAKQLRLCILIGSILPFLIFALWQWLVLGSVPVETLAHAYKNDTSATIALAEIVKNPKIIVIAQFFSLFAIITSFIGVTMSLSDFLSDGLRIKPSAQGRLMALLLTFTPPLLFVFSFERGFLLALNYAGVFVAILLLFLPAAMAWNLKEYPFYRSFIGRVLLLIVMLFALGVVTLNIMDQAGLLKPYIEKYV